MEIREATIEDLDMLVENRMEFVCSIRDIPNMDEFKEQTKLYIKNHIEGGTLLSYIAVENGKIVASSILCIYETIPRPRCINGKTGLLLNVYTLKKYRGLGLAYRTLSKLIEKAQELGVSKIQLEYTDDGYELYEKLGFKSLNRNMELNFI